MNVIITAATVFTMFLNSGKAIHAGGDYYYNADIQNSKVCMMDVYHQNGDKMLSRELEYHFTYDEQNRLISKEAYKWNPVTMDWNRYYCLVLNYTDDGYSIEMKKWNSNKKTYDTAKERSVYHIVNGDVASISNYKWNDKSHDFVLTNTTYQDPLLLAHVIF